jgi:GINS complex subunit 1
LILRLGGRDPDFDPQDDNNVGSLLVK